VQRREEKRREDDMMLNTFIDQIKARIVITTILYGDARGLFWVDKSTSSKYGTVLYCTHVGQGAHYITLHHNLAPWLGRGRVEHASAGGWTLTVVSVIRGINLNYWPPPLPTFLVLPRISQQVFVSTGSTAGVRIIDYPYPYPYPYPLPHYRDENIPC